MYLYFISVLFGIDLIWELFSDLSRYPTIESHVSIHIGQDRDTQKMQWITRFVEELKDDKWVLPALKQIREICQLFTEVSQ